MIQICEAQPGQEVLDILGAMEAEAIYVAAGSGADILF